MSINAWHKQRGQIQEELDALRFQTALRLARQAPRDQFAAVLVAAADTDPAPGRGRVPIDWDALTPEEIELIAAWRP